KQVGRLFALLKELGLDNNTIVFFTSDNGTTHLVEQVDYEFFDSVGPLRGLKGSLHEGGIRVPMVAWWPGRIAPATVSEHVAAHYDVLATFAGLVGAEPPASTDGISFLPTLLGDARAQRRHEYLFWDFTGYGGQLAVRMGKWKGIKTDLVKNPEAPLELYNLEEDLSESTNVAGKYPDIAGRIGRIMLEGRSLPEFEAFRFGEYLEAGG
ncbi:MAG TPA: sulfatase-like hydrolase/transferase, partial [Candidatus Hydrogenedentes bacterium]|nr:sulfatase-like hydrolase/transferase [Candidatus Hydrogenedentota bacterium]